MKQSNDVLAEVEAVTNGYKPLAQAASKIFFALLGMANLHYLYEYSLQFFMDTIFGLLENEDRLNAIAKKDSDKRKAMINHLLF
jgi:dynein heavy chain 1